MSFELNSKWLENLSFVAAAAANSEWTSPSTNDLRPEPGTTGLVVTVEYRAIGLKEATTAVLQAFLDQRDVPDGCTYSPLGEGTAATLTVGTYDSGIRSSTFRLGADQSDTNPINGLGIRLRVKTETAGTDPVAIEVITAWARAVRSSCC